MEKELKVKISLDADTVGVSTSKSAVDALKKSIGLTSSSADRLADALKRVGHWGAGIYAASKAFDAMRAAIVKAADVAINYNSGSTITLDVLKQRSNTTAYACYYSSTIILDVLKFVEFHAHSCAFYAQL